MDSKLIRDIAKIVSDVSGREAAHVATMIMMTEAMTRVANVMEQISGEFKHVVEEFQKLTGELERINSKGNGQAGDVHSALGHSEGRKPVKKRGWPKGKPRKNSLDRSEWEKIWHERAS
jgi:hypothetical protein